jgi:hypothetical protein
MVLLGMLLLYLKLFEKLPKIAPSRMGEQVSYRNTRSDRMPVSLIAAKNFSSLRRRFPY